MLEVMGKIKMILHNIIPAIQNALFHAVMVDKTTDCSNQGQAVLVLRWVDDALVVHEDLLGFTMFLPLVQTPSQLLSKIASNALTFPF